eukprot:1196372-Prorocentrum_minimum.AAC.2
MWTRPSTNGTCDGFNPRRARAVGVRGGGGRDPVSTQFGIKSNLVPPGGSLGGMQQKSAEDPEKNL